MDPADQHQRPEGNSGDDVEYARDSFDDSPWEDVDLPHDWAIQGPFYTQQDPPVGGGMGACLFMESAGIGDSLTSSQMIWTR